ncbi:MAG TPA: YihY/virulence factor BrkB family protein [Thermoleophilaceae bacterium]
MGRRGGTEAARRCLRRRVPGDQRHGHAGALVQAGVLAHIRRAFALWQMSGAVRAAMGALNGIYEVGTDRSWRDRMLVSTGIALGQAACLIGALAVVTLAPLAYGDVGQPLTGLLFVARWGVAALLLLACVWLLVRFGPSERRPVRWASFGSVLVVTAWVLMSIGFGAYLRGVANYGSIFGNLASLVILLTYLYLSAIVFLGGAQVDSLVRDDALRRR